MSTHKHIDKICLVAALLSLILCAVFLNGEALGIQAADTAMGYENRLFDNSRVHTIDIVMDDWDSFISTAATEEYSAASVIIDGEAYHDVGIRGKGNTSLSNVSAMGSQRYSFKIEFDQYDKTKSYYGLDKLSLNNLIQDNTMMKDYLTYTMMKELGAAAPLCSFVYITVNGEDWGVYLAVEGIEDAFLQRNYGSDYGELYKPDSMSFGGGRGNGRDFDMGDFDFEAVPNAGGNATAGDGADSAQQKPAIPDGFTVPDEMEAPEGLEPPSMGGGKGGFSGGMGASDVKLQYIDDDPDSYSNIFDNAKTDITETDQIRLIQSLKSLSEGGDVSSVVDIEAVIRYFVVHNYVCNGDSYTGSMIHNYYLYEEDGVLSMLPWDYNLAYGTFIGGDASQQVNSPIDTPASSDDLPMLDWIFESEEYTALYHQIFAEFLDTVDIAAIIDHAAELIAPYVEKDPTKFCTVEEFEAGVAALRQFCVLRSESVLGQLDGTIPATNEGQSADKTTLVDTGDLNLSDMGTMGGAGGFGPGRDGDRQMPDMGDLMSGGMPEDMSAPENSFDAETGVKRPEGMGFSRDGKPQENTEVPADAKNPESTDNPRPSRTNRFPSEADDAAGMDHAAWSMIGVSLFVLTAGLVFAIKFKK